MTAGINATLVNTFVTAVIADAAWVALAVGDPGAAGTSNPSSVTTREAVTWGSVSGGAASMSNTPEWTSWAGTSPETEEYIAFWSASTSGTFGMSMELTAPVTLNTGDSITIVSASVTVAVAS